MGILILMIMDNDDTIGVNNILQMNRMAGRYLVVDVQQEVVEGNTNLFLLLSCFAKLILFLCFIFLCGG